jgi:hypothetical protein
MNKNIIISVKKDYIRVESNGEKSFEFATDLWTQVVRSCEKHNCFKILGIANTTVPINTIGAVEHVDLFKRLDITDKYRIAWVETNPDCTKSIHLTEIFLSSSGVDCKVLSNEQEAKKWLLYGKLPDETP